ncbi:MAG TPA: TAXI family TRAP transporter solute-binding subunit, partial [Vicinamibacterales bacterium]|nr:TAXI family TRAP transporter solute-binding subunit [Vicinamibacterales bacterium]
SGVTIRLLPTADLLPSLRRDYGALYFPLEIPASAYPDVAAPVPVVGVANVLVANRSMPDDLAYHITRLLFEKQGDLAAIHPEARNLRLAGAVEGSPAPFHPGAIRFYRERGAWQDSKESVSRVNSQSPTPNSQSTDRRQP